MDKNQKMKIAKALVMLDDCIGSSGGLADFLGKLLANGVGLLVGADLGADNASKSENVEQVEG